MKRFSYAVALLLPLLAACSGGGSSTPVALPQAVTAPLGPVQALTEAQSDAVRQPQPQYTSNPADLLYVGNVGNNSISVYHHDQQGNTSPIYVISGSKTGIDAPGQLSEDAQGNLYVANGSWLSQSKNPAILVFAHGANGNVAPIRRLAGPLTGIHSVAAMTVDQITGKIFVVDILPQESGNSNLLRFPANATGNQAPLATLLSLLPAVQLAFDSTRQNIIEAHAYTCCYVAGEGVDTYPKHFPNDVHLNSLYVIHAFASGGLADDPTTKTYLASSRSGDGIFRLAENTVGYGPDGQGGPANFTPPPVSMITGNTCGGQLALGYLRNIYVTGCAADAVYVYAHDASGNVAPLRILSGSATKLSQPYGIYEGQ